MTEATAEADADLLPAEDRCVGSGGYSCGLPEAKHTGWQNGGPNHAFRPPERRPRPERIAGSFIQTAWVCTHCGADCDVWGVADDEWMECGECGKQSYVSVDFSTPARAGADQ